LLDSLSYSVEDRYTESGLAAPARGTPGDDLRAVFDAAFRLEAAFTPRDALHEDARLFVNQYAHS
jgi:hypothetical protein